MNAKRWLVLASLLWGSSFFTMKTGLEATARHAGEAAAPTAFLALRFAVAALLYPLLVPAALRGLTRAAVRDGLLLSIPFHAGVLLQVFGLARTPSAVAAFLTSLTVVLTPVLGRLFFRERPAAGTWAGAGLAFLGIALISGAGHGRLGLGETLTAAGAVAFAAHIHLTGLLTRTHAPEALTWLLFASGAAVDGAATALQGVPPRALGASLADPAVLWTVLFTATFCSAVAMTLMNRHQKAVSATEAGIIYALEPLFAAVFAAAFAGEPLTARTLLGGAALLAGPWVAAIRRPQPGPREGMLPACPDPPPPASRSDASTAALSSPPACASGSSPASSRRSTRRSTSAAACSTSGKAASASRRPAA
jgi:drug/metabolite transporter (DMT)-like permease